MERVFRIGDIESFEALPSGHKAWVLAKVGNSIGSHFTK